MKKFSFKPNSKKISDIFLFFRQSQNLSQEAAADLLGVHRITISNWERGNIPKNLQLFWSIQEFLLSSLPKP